MPENIKFRTDKPPVFADEVLIFNRIKISKTKKASGFIRLHFIDTLTSSILADVTLDNVTSEGLVKIIDAKLKEMETILKSKDPEKEVKKLKHQPAKVSNKEEVAYTG